MRRPPSAIEAIADVPEVLDFPRDIQPILDQLCVSCHGYEKTAAGGPRAGRVILTGDRGPIYSHSYYALTAANLFSDGRNQPRSNYAPRRLGSAASRLLNLLDGSHYGVKADAHQKTMLRLWIETGAAYPGTYAALGSGMIGGYLEEQQIDTDADWPAAKAAGDVIARRCAPCHDSRSRRLPSESLRRTGRHLVAIRPDGAVARATAATWSSISPAPRSRSSCSRRWPRPPVVLASAAIPRPRQPATVFASTVRSRLPEDFWPSAPRAKRASTRSSDLTCLDSAPPKEWVREMKRYGLLPAGRQARRAHQRLRHRAGLLAIALAHAIALTPADSFRLDRSPVVRYHCACDARFPKAGKLISGARWPASWGCRAKWVFWRTFLLRQ